MLRQSTDLRTLMALRRLSARDISERSGIHASRLSRLLSGREPLTTLTRKRIERAIFADLLEEVRDDRPAA